MNRSMKIRVLLLSLSVVAFLLTAQDSAWAQATASLRGTVTDPSGAIVAGAKITLTNMATNIARQDATGGEGGYLFELVQPGTYKLSVSHPGFATFTQAGIVVEVNQNARVDVAMKVGQSSEVVEVTANAPQVDTTGAVLGKVEDSRRLEDLPILEREAGTLSLGLLQAGVFALDKDDGSLNPFSVSGQRSESLTFLLDGGDNTDFLGNNIVENPIADAVQEFKILTNNYDAQFGRSSGGIVNQVIKSGTNSLHGDAFEYFRNDVLNANNFLLNAASVPRSPFKRNLFGGSLGGRIKKDKAFFFGSYEGSRRREGATPTVLQVLSPAQRHGDFSSLLTGAPADPCPAAAQAPGDPMQDPGQLFNPTTSIPTFTCSDGTVVNVVTPADIFVNNQVPVNKVINNYIQKFLPSPNIAGTNNFVASPVASVRQDRFVIKSDYNVSTRDTLSFVYLFDDRTDFFPLQVFKGASTGGNVPVGSASTALTRRQVGSLTWTHTFSAGLINQARFGANRRAGLQSKPVDTTTPAALGFTNVNPDDPKGVAPPILFTNSFILGPSPQGPTTEHDATFQWSDDVTMTRGKHEWKFGTDVRRVRNNFVFDFFTNGSLDFTVGNFTGNELADFVGGFPDNYTQFAKAIYGIRTSSISFYGQDTWKIRPRLTLNLGLRYEYNTPQTDIHNEILGFFPGQQSTVFPGAPPGILYPGDPGTPNKGLVFADRNNFAPRVGFAWDIFGNSKLVMRGGGGIFYDIEDGALNLQFGGQAPFGAVTSTTPVVSNFQNGIDPVADPFGSVGLTNPFPFRSAGTFTVPKVSFAFLTDPHFETPYSENFNYGFEYQMTKNTMVEAVYVGSLGRKLIQGEEVNFPVPSVMMQQLANSGGVNPECARPLAACVQGTGDPNPGQPVSGANASPNATPTGATSLLTNKSIGLSASHEFQLTVDKRFSHGFLFRAAYTLSKTIDTSSGFRARSSVSTNPLNYRQDRALADFDTPQRLVISGIWELPITRPFRNNRLMRKVTEGWQINAIASFQAGNPFTFFSNSNSSQQDQLATDGVDLDRPDINGKITKFDPRSVHTFTSDCTGGAAVGPIKGNFFVDPTVFNCSGVPQFTFGTLGRNAIRGPGINNWDLSFIKRTTITERIKLEFRAEFFNAFNHTQFLSPDPTGQASTFGQVTQTRDPRLGQLALKLSF